MKSFMLNLKHQLLEHPKLATFWALLSGLVNFFFETWSFNIILVFFLFVLIAIDTWTGIQLAKFKGEYDYKILKEKTMKKVWGYVWFLIGFGIFTAMLFIMNFKDGKPVFNPYYLNIFMMTAILFFGGVEFLSIKDNVMKYYGIKTPASIVGQVENFVNSGGKEPDKLLENK